MSVQQIWRIVGWHTQNSRFILPTLVIIASLIVWQLYVILFHVPLFVLPRPSDVGRSLFSEAGSLLPAAWVTAQAIALGFLSAVVLGVPIAVVLVSSKWIERAYFPLLLGAQLVPKVALAPLLTVWLGLGMPTEVMIAFLLSFFPITVNTMIGMKAVETGKLQVARSMGASSLAMFVKIKLPNALPHIFAGMKVASTLAVVGAIVGEFVGARSGLGNILLISNSNFDTVTMFAAITYLTIIGMSLFFAIEIAENFAIPWHVSRRTDANK